MTDTTLGLASLGILATTVAFWFRAIRRVAIPTHRGIYVAAWSAAAVLAVTALAGEPGRLGGTAAGLGLFAALFFLGSVAIGGQKLGEQAIQVGATMPDFTALDEHGEVFDSRELAGHPVLIKFFRGHW
jgi:hypothetical protein